MLDRILKNKEDVFTRIKTCDSLKELVYCFNECYTECSSKSCNENRLLIDNCNKIYISSIVQDDKDENDFVLIVNEILDNQISEEDACKIFFRKYIMDQKVEFNIEFIITFEDYLSQGLAGLALSQAIDFITIDQNINDISICACGSFGVRNVNSSVKETKQHLEQLVEFYGKHGFLISDDSSLINKEMIFNKDSREIFSSKKIINAIEYYCNDKSREKNKDYFK